MTEAKSLAKTKVLFKQNSNEDFNYWIRRSGIRIVPFLKIRITPRIYKYGADVKPKGNTLNSKNSIFPSADGHLKQEISYDVRRCQYYDKQT